MSHYILIKGSIFAIRVQKYNYIAILLLSAFLTKILVADTQWIFTAVTGTEYMHVNPFCKNKNAKGDAKDPVFTDVADAPVITLDALCTAQIHPKPENKKPPVQLLSDQIIHHSLGIDDIFREQKYPPPQLLSQAV